MSEWQDISTAPESTMVDLWAVTGLQSERIADCWLFKGEWRTASRIFGDWEYGAGRMRGATPTHWMERPAPPTPLGGK